MVDTNIRYLLSVDLTNGTGEWTLHQVEKIAEQHRRVMMMCPDVPVDRVTDYSCWFKLLPGGTIRLFGELHVD